jgi:small subunit ribosomal protein SAe
MSAANKGVLSLQEEDLTKILVANAHLGSQNLDFQMEQYIFRRKPDGMNNVFRNKKKTTSRRKMFNRERNIFNLFLKPYLKKGVCLFNVRKMWDKLVLAARAIAAIENPADVCVISARQISQRGVLKYARYTG